MPSNRLIALFAFAIAAYSCKEDETLTDNNIEQCVTTLSDAHGSIVPDRYIITFDNPDGNSSGRKGETAARVFANHSINSDRVKDVVEGERAHYVVELSSDEVAELKSDAAVVRIEPERMLSINACFTVREPSLVTWNINKTGFGDGTGKTAWVLDTGVDLDHPDLNVDNSRSKSFVEGKSTADDDNGHGTHISGVIGAKNNSFGTLGVASNASIVALKILDEDGEGLLSVALKALAHVRNNGKAGDAMNISMGLEDISQTLEDEVRAVAAKGIFVVIAAGNEGTSANKYSPARTAGSNIFTISAVDSLQHFATFSNYGNDVIDFAAPGVRIPSTYINGKYAIMSGTSMAAPHVTGLLLLTNGNITTRGYAIEDPDGTPDPIAGTED